MRPVDWLEIIQVVSFFASACTNLCFCAWESYTILHDRTPPATISRSFDRSLKSRNPDWGVRNLADVVKAAKKEGLELVEKVDMPANNTSLIFRRIFKPKEI